MHFATRSAIALFNCFIIVAAANLFMPGPAAAQEPAAAEPAATESDQTAVDPREVITQGNEALEKGDFAAALKIFDELVVNIERATDPAAYQFRPFALAGRGRALTGMNEDEAALADFNEVINEQANFVDALIGRGELYLKARDNEKALIDFQSAIAAQRSNLRAHFGLGKASVLLGGMEQGIKTLSRVIAADPNNAEAFQLRGRALNGVYKTNEAIADFQQALSLNPEDHEAYFWLGVTKLRAKDYRDAANQITNAIEHYKPKPDQEGVPYYEGYYALASAYIELGKVEQDEAAKKAAYQATIDVCENLLKQIDTTNPNFNPAQAAALFSRGVGERMLGQLDKAIKSFSQAIELNPDLGDAYFRRGICLHMIGEDKMAISDFVQAANLNPYDDPRSNMWEGFTYAKLGEYYQAVRAYGNAIAASDRYTPAYVNRGLAYMVLGEYDRAIADFNDAIRLEPTKAEYYFKRGIAYKQLGDDDKAADSFASAIEFDKQHAAARRHLQSLGRSASATEYRRNANTLASPSEQ